MFIDASAIVAILVGEPPAPDLLARLEREPVLFTSALAVFEAALAIARLKRVAPEAALADIAEFVDSARVACVAIDFATAEAAVAAHARYGKGRHPADLNMGDCFSYAAAKQLGTPLLYVGDDFAATDLA